MFRRTSAVLVSAIFLVSAFSSAQAGMVQLLPADFSQVLATLQSQHIIDSAATFRPEAILTPAEALSLVLRTTTVQPKLLAEPSLWKDVPIQRMVCKECGSGDAES